MFTGVLELTSNQILKYITTKPVLANRGYVRCLKELYFSRRNLKHTVKGPVSLELLELFSAEVLPPVEEHGVADEFEPGGEFQFGVLEHLLEFLCRNILSIADLVRAHVQINIGLDEKDVIDYHGSYKSLALHS